MDAASLVQRVRELVAKAGAIGSLQEEAFQKRNARHFLLHIAGHSTFFNYMQEEGPKEVHIYWWSM